MISAGVYLFGCAVYWFWASGELQPWAKKTPAQENCAEKQQNTVTSIGHNNEAFEANDS